MEILFIYYEHNERHLQVRQICPVDEREKEKESKNKSKTAPFT